MTVRSMMTALCAAASILAAALPASAVEPGSVPDSVMRVEWDRYLGLPWQFDPPVPFVPGEGPENDGDLVVFGYLPYWKVGDVTLQMKLLSHLAYFGVGVNGDGSLGDTRHWGQPAMDEITAAAHADGVKVVLVLTAFSATVIETLLASPANRAAAIANLVDVVSAAGGDGVNVDFEGVPVAVKSQFVQFVSDLKDAMDAAIGESSVTLAMPAVDWKGAYDYDALAAACDGLFLMEYDFHYAGGDPGPVSPMAGSTKWGKYSVTWSLDDYDTWGGVANRDKFILGLPLYGYDWPANLSQPPSTAVGDAQSIVWSACDEQGQAVGWQWDADSASPWFEYYSGDQYRQVWCENGESLAMRMALARERGLAGVGFWALGYEGDRPEPWQAIVNLWDLGGGETTVETVERADEASAPDAAEPAPDQGAPVDSTDAGDDVSMADPGQAPFDAGFDSAAADAAFMNDDRARDIPAVDAPAAFDSSTPADAGMSDDSVTDTGGSGGCSAAGPAPAGGGPLPVMAALLLFAVLNTILRPRRGRPAGAR